MVVTAPTSRETPCGDAGVVDGMLGIAVTEIILDEALVETAVGEREPTGMAQHVGVDRRHPARAATAPTM